MYEEENKDEPGTFAIFFAGGESLAKQGEYQKAIDSFSKALEFQPGERSCLVARSKCYLQLGNTSAALQDAEDSLKEDKKYHRGLYHKAEALYQMGDFEYALVYYHRGFKLRPELGQFKLGIQKAQEAIQNSIGTPEQCHLELVGDLTHFTKQAEMAKKKKQVKKAVVRPIGAQVVTQQKPKERKPVASDRTVKELLGELFADKQYLEGLLNDKKLSLGQPDNELMDKIHYELEYLDGRVEFWRQEKPMYARKREKELKKIKPEPTKPIGMSLRANSSTANHTRYVLKSLDEIDAALSRGEPERGLDQGKSLLRTIQNVSDTDLSNKTHFIATVHSCIGMAALDLGDSVTALEHHLKDYAISRDLESREGFTRALDNLVKVYVAMGEYQDALNHLEERSAYVKASEESVWLHHEMGRCYLELGQFDQAKQSGEKAMGLASETQDNTWYLNASVLVALAEAKSEDWNAALQSYQRSLEIAKIVQDNAAEEAITKALAEVNEKIVEELKSKEAPKDAETSETGNNRGSEERESSYGNDDVTGGSDLGDEDMELKEDAD